MSIQFEVFGSAAGVFHNPHAPFRSLNERLDRAIEDRDQGIITPAVYIKELQQMVADEPEFINGYAHLGHMYYQQGKPKKSLG